MLYRGMLYSIPNSHNSLRANIERKINVIILILFPVVRDNNVLNWRDFE